MPPLMKRKSPTSVVFWRKMTVRVLGATVVVDGVVVVGVVVGSVVGVVVGSVVGVVVGSVVGVVVGSVVGSVVGIVVAAVVDAVVASVEGSVGKVVLPAVLVAGILLKLFFENMFLLD
jgi:hypothetical protein